MRFIILLLLLSFGAIGQTYNFNGKQTFKTNVGIGTYSPSKLLHVAGTIKGDSIQATRIKLTSGASSGYVLTSDGSGNASWQSASGGSGITVGSTTITSGTSGRVAFNNAGVYGEDDGIAYSSANKRLTLGGATGVIPLVARNSTWSTNFTVTQNNGRNSGAIAFYNDALTVAQRFSILYRTEFSIMDENSGNFPFYCTTSDIRLGFNTSIGTLTTPTARLHISAGTATAGTAPIKLTSGTLLTTPENGTFEYDGSFLYFTLGGTRYKVTLTP